MDADGRSGGRPQTGSTSGGTSDDTAANDHPKVVLVTGACRFLGGYLTARLAQNPAIDHVIAVDAVTPSKDLQRRMGRAEFVRADIRNPFIAKVIRNGDVDTVVVAFADMQGRLTGKRISARLFVDDVAEPAPAVDGTLSVAAVVPDPARLTALAAPPDRRRWWIDRIVACLPLTSPSRV